MRNKISYLRFILFIILAMVILAYSFSSIDPVSALSNWIYWLMLIVAITIGLSAEITVGALQSILFRSMTTEAQEAVIAEKDAKREAFIAVFRNIYKKLTASKAISEEQEIILDHNYDGIQELDNKLPPWWVWGFYTTILFAVVYMGRFHVFNDYTQAEEYDLEIVEAKIAIAEWKKTAKDLVDVNTVTLLTEAEDLKVGKAIFNSRCVACHKADGGGGIGPNLTDEFWILGGGIKNVFRTVSEGGRSGKGMIPWKTEFKPAQIAQVSSYVISLQGTTPAAPKEPQGKIWKEEEK